MILRAATFCLPQRFCRIIRSLLLGICDASAHHGDFEKRWKRRKALEYIASICVARAYKHTCLHIPCELHLPLLPITPHPHPLTITRPKILAPPHLCLTLSPHAHTCTHICQKLFALLPIRRMEGNHTFLFLLFCLSISASSFMYPLYVWLMTPYLPLYPLLPPPPGQDNIFLTPYHVTWHFLYFAPYMTWDIYRHFWAPPWDTFYWVPSMCRTPVPGTRDLVLFYLCLPPLF